MEKHNPPPYSPQDTGMYPPPPGPHVPPPQQHMMPPPPQPQVIVHTSVGFGPQPTHIRCPSCHADVTTTVKTESTTKTHLFALLLCLFGLWPCACLPYCMDSCQDLQHYCPSCGTYLGCCLCSCIPYCMDSCMAQQHYCPNCNTYLGKYDN